MRFNLGLKMKSLFAGALLLILSAGAADAPICGTAFAASCCKVCKAGKACGNSCISRDKQCHRPKGCACDG